MAASVNDNLDQTTSSATGRPVTATLSAPGHSIGGTSIGVSVATNWSTTTGIHFSIYATTTVGSLTVKDTSTQTDWKGTLSGTTISNMTITGGTDQDYSAGAIVEITPTARWAKDLYDWAIAQHKQDGTHANTITTDTINENTGAAGVTIDGLNIKDSKLNTNNSVVTANITDAAITPVKRSGGFKVGTFSVSATGNVSVTGVGFVPKYIEFDYLTTVASNNRGGRGCMTASAQYAIGNSTSSGPTSSTDASTSLCLYAQSGGGTVFITLAYVSMDADGFTVNCGTLSGTHTVGYKAFG